MPLMQERMGTFPEGRGKPSSPRAKRRPRKGGRRWFRARTTGGGITALRVRPHERARPRSTGRPPLRSSHRPATTTRHPPPRTGPPRPVHRGNSARFAFVAGSLCAASVVSSRGSNGPNISNTRHWGELTVPLHTCYLVGCAGSYQPLAAGSSGPPKPPVPMKKMSATTATYRATVSSSGPSLRSTWSGASPCP
jgi:hypothetical protein